MAKAVALASALCILAIATFANAHHDFNVEGDVYCDPCRVQFETELARRLVDSCEEGAVREVGLGALNEIPSQHQLMMEGRSANVRLECRHADTKAVTYSLDGVTGPNGQYSLPVVGDHGDEICEVSVVKSPSDDCNEPLGDKSRVVLASNDGMHSGFRFANAIGFQTKTALPQCGPVLFNMGVVVGSQ
ncbi:pollen Ole e 1 allergen and extensin family protein [Striga asiatica]|uniref:Pollen Ole e 1 allergen and extensin family protein n=1 Tax=Striga asiatica TaxID=4170 RepID=A0A5A7QRU9_STRAF|nr:pollen Ole e 1 allergen and extensin family protein [Striga asiatica]